MFIQNGTQSQVLIGRHTKLEEEVVMLKKNAYEAEVTEKSKKIEEMENAQE